MTTTKKQYRCPNCEADNIEVAVNAWVHYVAVRLEIPMESLHLRARCRNCNHAALLSDFKGIAPQEELREWWNTHSRAEFARLRDELPKDEFTSQFFDYQATAGLGTLKDPNMALLQLEDAYWIGLTRLDGGWGILCRTEIVPFPGSVSAVIYSLTLGGLLENVEVARKERKLSVSYCASCGKEDQR